MLHHALDIEMIAQGEIKCFYEDHSIPSICECNAQTFTLRNVTSQIYETIHTFQIWYNKLRIL